MNKLMLKAEKYEELYNISRKLFTELSELYDERQQRDLYIDDLIKRTRVLLEECKDTGN